MALVSGVRIGRSWTWDFAIPVFVLMVLVLPLLILLSPVFLIACLAIRVNPLHAYSLLWQLLSSLRGTHMEVEHRNHAVSIRML
jgi:hypothetical protein